MKNRGVFSTLAFVAGLASASLVFAQDPARDDAGGINNIRAHQVEPARVPGPQQGIILFNSGPFVTHPGGGAGGADASALQTALGMGTFGFTASAATPFRIADDFTVPAGATWRINQFVAYCYQTGSTTTSTITSATLRIWDGPPGGTSNIVFGDATTNILANSTWSNAYRALDTTLTNNQRPIMANTLTVGITLTAGTYWVDYAFGGTLASGPFAPPVTVLGQTTTGNGMQFDGANWVAVTDVGPQGFPFSLIGPDLTPVGLTVDSVGNKVLDPAETAIVAPQWRNDSTLAITNVTGALSNFTGPAGGTYTIVDANAAYGDISAGATATCTTDCYSLIVTGTRPALHWDTTVLEATSISGTAPAKTWTLHVGDSFTDVPGTNGFYRFVETLLHKGVTGGCGTDTYCPSNVTTREQMSAFVLVAKEGAGYNPPACVPPNLFSDVPETSPFCKFIEELANRGVVAGCGPNLYCPTQPGDARADGRLRAAHAGSGAQPAGLRHAACSPTSRRPAPSASGSRSWPGAASSPAAAAATTARPTRVTREQMGVFLAVTFSLALYGV